MKGFSPSNDNGREGGGSGGGEHRYHFPAVDCARFDEASTGAVDAPERGQAEVVPESKISTMGGPPRGTLGGKMLPDDRGGFC